MTVEEEIQAIFRRLGEITLDAEAQQTLAVAEAEVLGVLAKAEAERNQKLTESVRDIVMAFGQFLQNNKGYLSADTTESGATPYITDYDLQEALEEFFKSKKFEALLGAEQDFSFAKETSTKETPCDNNPEFSCKYPVTYREKHCRKNGYCPYGKDSEGC